MRPVIIWLSILQIQIQIITSYRQAVLLRGNYMHLQRTIGVLEGLAEEEGLTYSEDVEKLAASEKQRL